MIRETHDRRQFFDTRAKTYVQYVLDHLQITPTQLATRAKLASTTLTRALNDPTHKFTLSMRTLGKIYMATGVNPNPFFDTKNFAELAMMPYERDNFDDSEQVEAIPDDEPLVEGSTIVIGETKAGSWVNPRIARIEDSGAIWLRVPKTRQLDAFAVRVGDNFMVPFIEPKEYAVCLRIRDSNRDVLSHGSMVVVERWTSSPRLMELTLRRLVIPENASPYLKFENVDDPKEDLIEMPIDLLDTDEVKIIGQVLYAVRYVDNSIMREEDYERRLAKYKASLEAR